MLTNMLKIIIRADFFFPTYDAFDTTRYPHLKKHIPQFLHYICTINFKWIIDATIEVKTIKLIEKQDRRNCYLGVGKEFLDTGKVWIIKEENQ